jgi:hypothetical protein
MAKKAFSCPLLSPLLPINQATEPEIELWFLVIRQSRGTGVNLFAAKL